MGPQVIYYRRAPAVSNSHKLSILVTTFLAALLLSCCACCAISTCSFLQSSFCRCVSAVSQVKTQRALNDYRKSAYPHYKDELTRLRYIGAITATRLKDARAWLGKDVPLECVDTVQKLKQLLEYADNNRYTVGKVSLLLFIFRCTGKYVFIAWCVCWAANFQTLHFKLCCPHRNDNPTLCIELFMLCSCACNSTLSGLHRPVEQKLLELLNMRGRHRHKWDFLRNVLSEKVVYDDNAFRVWYAPEGNGCGLLYSTKQAQVGGGGIWIGYCSSNGSSIASTPDTFGFLRCRIIQTFIC